MADVVAVQKTVSGFLMIEVIEIADGRVLQEDGHQK
jgi:hypothetical protein